MNIFASYRYQLADHKKSILIFYLVIIIITCIAGVSAAIAFHSAETTGDLSISGGELATLVFLFVVGLCTFKETFFFSTQNGSSRKTIFAAKLLTMGSVAVIMSFADTLLYLAEGALRSITHVSVHTYRAYILLFGANGESPALLQAKSFFLEVMMALAAMAAGYFITVLFYRLNKAGKIAVSVGVPMLFMVVLPLLDDIVFHGAITRLLGNAAVFLFSTPSHMYLTCFVIFALASGLAFLLMRKAVVR